MKKLSVINKIFYLLNSLLAAILLLSYLLPFVSPKNTPSFAILSLFVPVLTILNFLFIIYWVVNLKKHFLISTFIIAIGSFLSTPLYKVAGNNSSFNDDIKIMSYNVRMFNHWKWIKDDSIPKKINTLIDIESPDLLLFQEYYTLEKHKKKYPYKYIKTKNKKDKMGLAIFSKLPIINKGSLNLKGTTNNIIFVDILRKKDTIRVYNLHLQSLQLSTNKQNFGQDNSEKLMTNLKLGFKKQAEQTTVFLAHEKQWKGKKIIAGDFNNTSYSWVYNQISANKKDAFIEVGEGFGKTFSYWFPMRIDFILTDKTAVINNYKSSQKKYSDHFAILAKVNW